MQNQETKKRRLCLFAGYDKEQKIDDYVILLYQRTGSIQRCLLLRRL